MQTSSASLAENIRLPAAERTGVGTPKVLFSLAAMPLLIAASVDLARYLQYGLVTGLGALTIVQAVLLLAAVITCASYPKQLLVYAAPYLGFLVWILVSTVWSPRSVAGLQNAAVFGLFGLALLLAGTLASRDPSRTERTIDRAVHWIDAIGWSTVILHLLLRGLPEAEDVWYIGPRSLALVGLISLSWHLAFAYHDQRGWTRAAMWLVAIVLSLSRTASAIALISVLLVLGLQLRFNPRSLAAGIPRYVISLAVLAVLILQAVPYQDRFFSGDTSIEIGQLRINASGRMSMWPVVMESARESPIIGKGLGSSQFVVEAAVANAGHPHNDYLRVGHDLGLVGLALLTVAFVSWLCITFRRWYRLARRRAEWGRMELAAFLGLLGLMLAMVTDNGIIYPFYMGPLGILLGAGLGRSQMFRSYGGVAVDRSRR